MCNEIDFQNEFRIEKLKIRHMYYEYIKVEGRELSLAYLFSTVLHHNVIISRKAYLIEEHASISDTTLGRFNMTIQTLNVLLKSKVPNECLKTYPK